MKNFKKGFTLAEVLVTLTIIGVIAALTLPLLMGGTNTASFKTSYKKAISTLNQGIKLNQATDMSDPGTCPGCDSAGATGAQALASYFSNGIKTLGGATGGVFTTQDGMVFTFNHSGTASACDDATVFTSAVCTVVVDVNGPKAPNAVTTGATPSTIKDQFNMIVQSSTVIPGDAGAIAVSKS
ncbi:MAG: type II secretion system protein [bacterium]